MIQCIKTLRYETEPKHGNAFAYAAALGLGKIDPPSSVSTALVLGSDIVLYSSLRRVADTIEPYQKQGVIYERCDTLREIPFNIEEFCPRGVWEKEKSRAVRRGFKEAFIHDTLPVSRKLILGEIKNILLYSRKEGQDKDIALVSHSFRMKIIEAFIKTSGKLEHIPELIEDFILDDKKTYEFGRGFKIQIQNLERLNL